jgi:hypothetical protein
MSGNTEPGASALTWRENLPGSFDGADASAVVIAAGCEGSDEDCVEVQPQTHAADTRQAKTIRQAWCFMNGNWGREGDKGDGIRTGY